MRCALSFDENKDLIDQKVSAWGEMQSLKEEPAYREEDIKSDTDKSFIFGYKFALDDVCRTLEMLVEDGDMKEDLSNEIQEYIGSELVMHLFSILDNQEVENE